MKSTVKLIAILCAFSISFGQEVQEDPSVDELMKNRLQNLTDAEKESIQSKLDELRKKRELHRNELEAQRESLQIKKQEHLGDGRDAEEILKKRKQIKDREKELRERLENMRKEKPLPLDDMKTLQEQWRDASEEERQQILEGLNPQQKENFLEKLKERLPRPPQP